VSQWTGIILAGQRPGTDDFAAQHGVAAKALIPIGGVPMLGRVARALLDSPSIQRVVVLAQDPESLLGGELSWMGKEPRISTAPAGAGISLSIASVGGTESIPYPLLVTTADHPLLTPQMVEAFIAAAGDSDTAFAMVERKTLEQVHRTRRTWVKFRGGEFTGANLFAFVTEKSKVALEAWAEVERDRKKALKLLFYLGPITLLGALTRTLTLEGAAARAGRRLGIRLRAVRLPFPEAAIDVDKPEDVELAERILAQASRG